MKMRERFRGIRRFEKGNAALREKGFEKYEV